MRLKGIFFLFVFISFLITPTIVTFSNVKVDISSMLSMNEEETSDAFKVDPKNKNTSEVNLLPHTILFKTSKNIPNNRSISFWKNIYFDTVSPPPEFSGLIG